MKKLTVLLLAAVLLCTCFALAACGGDEDTSSAPAASNGTSSAQNTSSTAAASSEAASSVAEASSEAASSEDTSSEDTTSNDVVEEGKVFWVTHYADDEAEGAGVIYLDTDTAGAWSTHVAFKPVEGEENVWEIVKISIGVGTGAGEKLEVPDGGFVYAVNTGNDWPDLVDRPEHANDSWIQSMRGSPDYTSDVCDNIGAVEMPQWKVGDRFLIEGLTYDEMLDGTIPTSTPDVKWYEDGDYDYGQYVCTATYKKVG